MLTIINNIIVYIWLFMVLYFLWQIWRESARRTKRLEEGLLKVLDEDKTK